PDKDRFSFFIDQRYFPIKDLAYLALGRISHEQAHYDEAYYFYFQVPDDSEKLSDALFEAAWSMFQKGEWEAARALLDQFGRLLELLKVDPRFFRLHEYAAGLDREVADARRTVAMWRELAARQSREKPRPVATEATELLREVRTLEPVAAGDPEMKKKVGRL